VPNGFGASDGRETRPPEACSACLASSCVVCVFSTSLRIASRRLASSSAGARARSRSSRAQAAPRTPRPPRPAAHAPLARCASEEAKAQTAPQGKETEQLAPEHLCVEDVALPRRDPVDALGGALADRHAQHVLLAARDADFVRGARSACVGTELEDLGRLVHAARAAAAALAAQLVDKQHGGWPLWLCKGVVAVCGRRGRLSRQQLERANQPQRRLRGVAARVHVGVQRLELRAARSRRVRASELLAQGARR